MAIAADAKDRGRALLRDDSVRTGKRHNSKVIPQMGLGNNKVR